MCPPGQLGRDLTTSQKSIVKIAKENRGTGGCGEELSEVECILEDLTEIGDETDQRVEEEAVTTQNEIVEDRRKAWETSGRSMEITRETRQRLGIKINSKKRRA